MAYAKKESFLNGSNLRKSFSYKLLVSFTALCESNLDITDPNEKVLQFLCSKNTQNRDKLSKNPSSLSSSTFSKCHIVIDTYWLPLPFLIRIVKLSPKGMVLLVCSDKYFQRRAKKEAHGKKRPVVATFNVAVVEPLDTTTQGLWIRIT